MTSPDALRAQLPDIGDALAAAMQSLHDKPDPSRCEDMAIKLQGAARHVLLMRERLMQEHGLNGQ